MPTLTRRAARTLALAVLAAAVADSPAPAQQPGGTNPIVVQPQIRPGLPIPQPVLQPPPANPPAKQPASSPGTAQPAPGASGGAPWPLASPGASRLLPGPGVLPDPAPPAGPAAKRRKPVEPFQMNAWWGFEPGARLGYIPVTPVATVVVQPGVFVPGSSDPQEGE